MKLTFKSLAAAAATVALVMGGAGVAMAETINSPGPLALIEITPDLNCNVRHVDDTQGEFYDDIACGTFVAVGGELYGPAVVPAGNAANPRTAWTPVSQTKAGSGSGADPFVITTTVTGGDLSVTQVDSYVTGENVYRTATSITNSSGVVQDAIVYHAADCYLGDNDNGFGQHNAATGTITCRSELPPAGRIEEFIPLTSGSNFLYASYHEVWAAVGSQLPFPDQVRDPDFRIDNGIGLSWSLSVGAGATQTVSRLTNFSPIGVQPLPTAISVTPNNVVTGQESAVAATVNNPNTVIQQLSSLTVTLPAGVTYVTGSTTGASEPTVSGNTLTFAGPIEVAAEGAATVNFRVLAATVSGGTLTLNGVATGGAPVLSSITTLAVRSDGDPEVVIPGNPAVIQATCPTPGNPTVPVVALPDNTTSIHYALSGEVAAGSTVTVTATAQTGYIFAPDTANWTITQEGVTATRTIVLDTISCELVPPVVPTPPPAVADKGELAKTGGEASASWPLWGAGVLLLVVGGSVALLARKKA